MKILIVENESYLAQSIASKLSGYGYECEISHSPDEALLHNNFDIILLSTNLNESGIYNVIEHFSSAIIILLVSYISTDTVSEPLKAGANDFIQKPFMIEELVRKIKHLGEFRRYKSKTASYEFLLNRHIKWQEERDIEVKFSYPLLIKSLNLKDIDSYVCFLSNKFNFTFECIDVTKEFNFLKFKELMKENALIYISDINDLKSSDKKRVLEFVKDKKIVLGSTNIDEEVKFSSILLEPDQDVLFKNREILQIDEYIKQVILSNEETLSDTEIAKRLGISRKSLWEKRRKYGISKKR